MLANSKSVAADVTATLRPATPVHVVHNAVDLETFAPTGPAEALDRRAGLAPPAGPVVRVGLVATFARWKGHEVFLRRSAAFPADCRSAATSSAVRCTIPLAASTPWTSCRRSRIDWTRRTHRLCRVSAARAGDARARHGRSRQHAAGAVRAGDRRGNGLRPRGHHERVGRGRGGRRCRRGRAHPRSWRRRRLSQCIVRLAADPELRRAFGVRARASACRRFDSSRLAREVVAVYEATHG